jgi:hypothetical protein
MEAEAPAESVAEALGPLLCVCSGVKVGESVDDAEGLGAALPVAPGCEGVAPPLPVELRVSPRGLALPLSDGCKDAESGGESEGWSEGEVAGLGDAAPDALPPHAAPVDDRCADSDDCNEGVQTADADAEPQPEEEGEPADVGEEEGDKGGVGVEAAVLLPAAL